MALTLIIDNILVLLPQQTCPRVKMSAELWDLPQKTLTEICSKWLYKISLLDTTRGSWFCSLNGPVNIYIHKIFARMFYIKTLTAKREDSWDKCSNCTSQQLPDCSTASCVHARYPSCVVLVNVARYDRETQSVDLISVKTQCCKQVSLSLNWFLVQL